jgi:mannose-6-phosphate isomerase-like protein (cupin superfamily)
MKRSKYEVEPIQDVCGEIRELYRSKELSIAHVSLRLAKQHLHQSFDEFYYVERGRGRLRVGDRIFEVKEGDLVYIPKGSWHQAEGELELIVISHPGFDPEDVRER